MTPLSFALCKRQDATVYSRRYYCFLVSIVFIVLGSGNTVCIATSYGLDGSEIESRWGRGFLHPSSPALGSNQPPNHWVLGLFTGDNTAWGMVLTTHPNITPKLKKKYGYTSTSHLGLRRMFWGESYVFY
jgi:hypothetical protein